MLEWLLLLLLLMMMTMMMKQFFFERNGNLGVKMVLPVINVGLKSFVCDGTLQR
jgi:hypothetical protein